MDLFGYPDQVAAAYFMVSRCISNWLLGLVSRLAICFLYMWSAFDHLLSSTPNSNRVSCGQVMGPFTPPPFTHVHISQLFWGVGLKDLPTGKWLFVSHWITYCLVCSGGSNIVWIRLPPFWSSVGALHCHCYCRCGPVDADSSPWFLFPPSLFR